MLVKELEDRRQEILLPCGFRDVEAGDPGLGDPDIPDDIPVRMVVEVKERLRSMIEGTRMPFAQFLERTQLLEKAR